MGKFITVKNNEIPVYQSAWQAVNPEKDFTHQFKLENLSPSTQYKVKIQAESKKFIEGQFTTAPKKYYRCGFHRCDTCQAIRSAEHHRKGHSVYSQMLKLDPSFFIHTGDIVYYDKGYLAKNVPDARRKWNHTFALPLNRNFQLKSPHFL